MRPESVQKKPLADISALANDFYKNCTAQKHPILSGEDLNLFCGCTSAHLAKNMTPAQMRASQTDTPEGQQQRARMTLYVYTPCIEHPTRALVTNQCESNPQVQNSVKNYKHTCGCLGDEMANFMKNNAHNAIKIALQNNINDLDPLGTLMQSPQFNAQSQEALKKCILKHAS